MSTTMPVEEVVRLFAEQSNEHAFILLNVNGCVTWWSSGAAHMFNCPSGQMVGRPLDILFTPEDIEQGIPEQEITIAREHGKAEEDRWQVRSDGARFWATGVLLALRDQNGNLIGFGKILRDRTDLRDQLETQANQIEALTSRDQQKNIFLATLSHELRNPLTQLSNAAQLLRMTVPGKAETEYPLKLIDREVEFIRRLVDDLLDVTRISTGKIRLETETVELREIIARAVEATQPLIEERDQKLQVLLPATPIEFVADPARLHQVLVNLITNAAKFTASGETIWVEGTRDGDEVIVHVEDNGVGIPDGMLVSIFDPFTQVETPLSNGGLGIGLSLVKTLVSLHGGSIKVRSEGVGKGSEFIVRLPLKHAQSAG
jgi:PAS domain S-box-containing protein